MQFKKRSFQILALVLAGLLVSSTLAFAADEEPVDIGSRVQLFLGDGHIIDEMKGDAELKLHQPEIEEVALVTDEPWEGNIAFYGTVFKDGDKYRMYYRAQHADIVEEDGKGQWSIPHAPGYAYAESEDGIHWEKPDLGIIEFNGSKDNNLILETGEVHNFTPFKDSNPDAKPEAQYKAVTGTDAMYAYQSSDGIHWEKMQEEPVIPGDLGAFDSQNIVFWDPENEVYRAYWRDWIEGQRVTMTSYSESFTEGWVEPVQLNYENPVGEKANFHLYTQPIQPYYRNPRIMLGFPDRYVDRPWSPTNQALKENTHYGHASMDPSYKEEELYLLHEGGHRQAASMRDALFMSSRNKEPEDGKTFTRWNEAFFHPGPEKFARWDYGGNGALWGMVETKDPEVPEYEEISMYTFEDYFLGDSTKIRRRTIRKDGFVSVNASYDEGEVITKPFVFEGDELVLNYATSAAGSIKVEIQDADGKPIIEHSLDECDKLFGDTVKRTVTWEDHSGGGFTTSVGEIEGKPIRLRFVLKDADLYSFHFAESEEE